MAEIPLAHSTRWNWVRVRFGIGANMIYSESECRWLGWWMALSILVEFGQSAMRHECTFSAIYAALEVRGSILAVIAFFNFCVFGGSGKCVTDEPTESGHTHIYARTNLKTEQTDATSVHYQSKDAFSSSVSSDLICITIRSA